MRGRTLGLLLVLAVAIAALLGARSSIPREPAVKRPAPVAAQRALIVILSYHHLSEEAPGTATPTIAPAVLRSQIQGAKAEGWTFLQLSDLVGRFERGEPLPERVLVLTFDDGYRSFRELALPILQQERVPATLAVVGSFATTPPPDLPPLLSWREIIELEQDELVEIAAHSQELHHWVTSNPFGDTTPSVAARRYLRDLARYEDRDEYRQRIRSDMSAAQRTLRHQLGHGVSVYVWPYGEYNDMAKVLARESGFELTLALGNRAVRPEDFRSGTLPRVMVTGDMRFSATDLRWMNAPVEVRAEEVDLEAVYDPDVATFRRNVDAVVERLHRVGATHAVLQACPGGDEKFRQAWFVNHQLPVKADVWSMVAAKLHHAGLKVWVRAPVLERAAIDFYADMAVYLPIDGVLFDDDANLPPETIDALMRTVRAWRPNAKFGRSLQALATQPGGVHPRFAEDLDPRPTDSASKR